MTRDFIIYGFVLLILVINEVNSRTSECLKVKLPNYGTVVGRYLVSHDGRGIRAFMGVPYADPPVGELRFKVRFFCYLIVYFKFITSLWKFLMWE